MNRPLRFGVQAWTASEAADWSALAQRAEGLGFDSFLIGDHFWEQLAPAPALVAAAMSTTRIRVGTMMLANDFRHPLVLAKDLATVDLLSGGRLEVGIGAGWMTSDYECSGIPMDPASVRIARLEESLGLLDELWSGREVSHQGAHYTLQGATCTPLPLQRPRPPFHVGGGGPRMLEAAARHADIVGISPSLRSGVFGPKSGRDASMAASIERVDLVRRVAAERFSTIELSMMVYVVSDTDDLDRIGRSLTHFGVDPGERHSSPHVWLGSPRDVAARLFRLRETLGVTYWVVQAELMDRAAPVIEIARQREPG